MLQRLLIVCSMVLAILFVPVGANDQQKKCSGMINSLTMQYNGDQNALVEVYSHKGIRIFSQNLSKYDFFTIDGFNKQETLGAKLSLHIDGVLDVEMLTICTKKFLVGMDFGQFTIRGGFDHKGIEMSAVDGYVRIGTLCGTVYEDKNNNNTQDTDENSTAGIMVNVTDAGSRVYSVETDSTGKYCAYNIQIGLSNIEIDTATLLLGTELITGENPNSATVLENTINQGGIDGYMFNPLAFDQNITIFEDIPEDIMLLGKDKSDYPLDYIIVDPVKHGEITGATPEITYASELNYNGTDSFTFRVNNGVLDSLPATVFINITPVNDIPVPQNDTSSTDEDVPVTISVLDNDSDVDIGDVLHIASVSTPSHGTATIVNNQILYSSSQDYNGEDSFTYIASDGNGGEAEARVDITIIAVNDAPVANIGDDITMVLSESVVLDASASYDVDGDELTYSWILNNEEISTSIHYTYVGREVGTFTFTLEVEDPLGLISSDSITVEVTEPNNETPTHYRDTFKPLRPIISDSSRMAMDADMRAINEEMQALITEAEALVAEKGFTLDTVELTPTQKAEIERRKAQIQEELDNHEN